MAWLGNLLSAWPSGYLKKLGEKRAEQASAAKAARRLEKDAESHRLGISRSALAQLRAPNPNGDVHDSGPDRGAEPFPDVAPGLPFERGPFAGRDPLFLYIGGDAQQHAHRGVDISTRIGSFDQVLVVVEQGYAIEVEGVERFDGTLAQQLGAAFERAGQLLAQRDGYLAVVLRPPLSGDYTQDARDDISYELAPALGFDVWLSWMEPLNAHTWPDMVVLEGPGDGRQTFRAVEQLLPKKSRKSLKRLPSGVRLPKELATRVLMQLAGNDSEHGVLLNEMVTPYGMVLSMLCGRSALDDMSANVSVDALPGLGAALAAQGWQVVHEGSDGPVKIPMDQLAKRSLAYRCVGATRRQLPVTSEDEDVIGTLPTPVRRLRESIREGDPLLALSPLVRDGRSWLESGAAHDRRADLLDALRAFGRDSAPGVWAHYYLALDGALQREKIDPALFGTERQAAADHHGVGVLYRAEEMEMTRLGGDLPNACRLARPLVDELQATPGPIDGDDSWNYAAGTSRFLIGNLLRRGGLYGAAAEWIRDAERFFDTDKPSQRVELLHSRYARAVCSAMLGEGRIEPIANLREDELMFGQALIGMATAHAAWVHDDLPAALESAEAAERAFRKISYDRYAARANKLSAYLTAWQAAQSGDVSCLHEVDVHLSALLAPSPASVDLTGLRPSAALGALYAASYFLTADAADVKSVTLPAVIVEESGTLRMSNPVRAVGLRLADERLRAAMGLPSGTRVPLLAD